MATITAKDLTKDYPRSPYEEMGGFPWLARMIDKVRALQANTLGEYVPFPCGGDQRFLGVTGVDPEAFKAQVFSGASDEQLVAWYKANAKVDAAALESYMQSQAQGYTDPEMIGYLDNAKAELKKQRPELDVDKAINFGHLICIEEGHAYPF